MRPTAFAEERIFAPLAMGDAGYRPPPELRGRVAPHAVRTIGGGTFAGRLEALEVSDGRSER